MLKYDLIESVARGLGDLVVKSTVATSTATTVASSDLIHPNTGQLKGYNYYQYKGGGAGQARVITDFTPGSDRLEVGKAFSPVPSTNSDFYIFRRFGYDDYKEAVDRAMGKARRKYLTSYCPTIALQATQFQYNVPSGLDYIEALRLVPSAGSDLSAKDVSANVFELRHPLWRYEDSQIVFDPRRISLIDFDNWICKVIGQTRPATLATDNATVEVNLEEYLIAESKVELASRLIKDNTEWKDKFLTFREDSKGLEAYINSQSHGIAVS